MLRICLPLKKNDEKLPEVSSVSGADESAGAPEASSSKEVSTLLG